MNEMYKDIHERREHGNSSAKEIIKSLMAGEQDRTYCYALSDPNDLSTVIYIDDVTEDNRRGTFFCPGCNQKLTPALGGRRIHHFKHLHSENEGGSCNYDNYLHNTAKDLFAREYQKCLDSHIPFTIQLWLPSDCNKQCVLKKHINCNERYFLQKVDLTQYFKYIEVEKNVHVERDPSRVRRPDILLRTDDGDQLWVEIWVNHKSTEEKLNDGSVLEIHIKEEGDLDQIKQHQIEETRETDSVKIYDKELIKRIIGFSFKTEKMPCDYLYVCDYDENVGLISNPEYLTTFERKSKGVYRLVLKLNWSGVHYFPGNNGKQYSIGEISNYCTRRANSIIIHNNAESIDPELDRLIVYESDYTPPKQETQPQLKPKPEPRHYLSSVTPVQVEPPTNIDCDSIIQGLNSAQEKAVRQTSGPVLIVAGAGSGKTKVLTSRIAYLLAGGCKAERILALTFTKKAAGEMKERIAIMVGARKARHLVMGTFHAVFVRFLREFSASLGYPKEFTIYDQSDSESAVKACVKELGLDDKIYKPREVLSRISSAKNALYLPPSYRANPEFTMADTRAKKPRIADLYELYQRKMKQAGVMDFDDILVNMNILLRDDTDALEDISSRFDYIMVDEYQDTNYAQYLILKKLAAKHHNLCVVGDDSQSIYAFRGAQIQNILSFRKDYPDSVIIRLERNYRSTQNIVDAANSVIAHNEGRIPKKCFSEGEKGEKIKLVKAYTEQEEAMLIVSDIIDRTRNERAEYQDFAILYRTNAQSRALEEQLRRRNIPYMIYSGNSFFDRAEIKDMMAYFKLSVNTGDDESFKRVVNQPARGIGGTSLSALNEVARAHKCPLFKAAWAEDYELYGLKPAAAEKIRTFCKMIDSFAVAARSQNAHDVAVFIANQSGLLPLYKTDTSIEGMARAANIEELLNSVAGFVEERQNDIIEDSDEGYLNDEQLPIVTLADFLENTALLSNVDVADDEDTNNKVALMTVHSAKGLEFPYVFIAGAEEELFPVRGMLAKPAEIEEERRLFYVALTRAKKAVNISFAETRMRNGQHESNPVSRFVKEIDEQYIDNPQTLIGSDDDSSDNPFHGGFGFGQRGGFGFKTRAFGGYRYGQSSQVQSFKRQESVPSPVRTVQKPIVQKPALIDANFQAVPMTELYEGERVEHNRFGAGKILEITGQVPELKATIDFDQYGKKLLLLKYAKLRPEKK